MSGFKEIIGQERIKQNLKNSILRGKVSHAYIFSGEEGIGKKTMANAFAMTLMCENGGTTPCMECRCCKQFLSGNEPDVIYVKPEKPGLISVSDIREQVNSDIVIKPYSSKYKIYIIDSAGDMNESAENALLKTIEEPPEYAVIMLLVDNPEKLLPTIRSRCVDLDIRPLANEDIAKYLEYRYPDKTDRIPIVSAFAKGNIGKAIALIESEEFGQVKEDTLSILKKQNEYSIARINQILAPIIETKDRLDDFLDIVLFWYRDLMVYKATKDDSHLLFQDEIFDIKKISGQMRDDEIADRIKQIEICRNRIRSYVKPELAVELLMIELKSKEKNR